MFWSQFSAHIWYDTPEFKANFKTLLKEWIKERRNSPSVIMWGLQNESTIPKAFAEECTQIIREMDPTSAKQRIVTTCNGGEGTDWNVIQNWSGTYGGNPYNYGEELTTQLLNGEYGAWRSADLHTEGDFNQKGELSENRFSQLMEIKVREAESVKDKIVGQYHWLLYSHENPGRTQNGEGYRDIDKVGPVNYKGIFTIWGEPLDAFYMYRANYVSKEESPMVYIVSHSWYKPLVNIWR
ncbi:glycoside hydrolase family 2 TIM barrel-domain containing protein [Thalassobellus suaedae]|uniref:Glycoside hydrolase family 2 TIM barrel-domain containing protein n=1 Tax=Thalassobellus suaedae TaxID=3074124 RepID=A0ABY9XU43_9FLAO|nr:glycoside hydrolase family 2 TIM barrel-domain containing protein [Flavobacteriaceae bacterium HL-DH14]